MPEAAAIDGVPLYTFGKHTVIDRTAIKRLIRESQPVRDALCEPSSCTRDIASAAFYAGGTPIARRLKWESGATLEALGAEPDMLRAGALLPGIKPILAAVRDNLGHLNMICGRIYW